LRPSGKARKHWRLVMAEPFAHSLIALVTFGLLIAMVDAYYGQ